MGWIWPFSRRRISSRAVRFVARLQAGEVGVVGSYGAGGFGIFEVDGVEAAVMGVVGIEGEGDEAVGKAALGGQAAEESGLAVAAIEVEVRGEFPGLLVEDVEGAVEVVNENAVAVDAGLFAHEVDAGEEAHDLASAVDFAGHGHCGEIADFEGDILGGGAGKTENCQQRQ